jgi:hypothetical protein
MTLIFDPNIVTVPPPMIYRTTGGNLDNTNAARYLAYKMCRQGLDDRTLRRWRELGKGPNYHRGGDRRLARIREALDVGEVALEHRIALRAVRHARRPGLQNHQHVGAHAALVGAEALG